MQDGPISLELKPEPQSVMNSKIDFLTKKVEGLNKIIDDLTSKVDELTKTLDGLLQLLIEPI